jgi:hypothetical protein
MFERECGIERECVCDRERERKILGHDAMFFFFCPLFFPNRYSALHCEDISCTDTM